MNASEVLQILSDNVNDDNEWRQVTRSEHDIYSDIPIVPKKRRIHKVRIVTEYCINCSIPKKVL